MRILTGLLGLALSLTAAAQSAPPSISAPSPAFEAGEHYIVLDEPVATSNPDKIEVVEAFSYLCGGCFMFAPLIKAWEGQLQDDVVLVHSHAIWNRTMESYARAYYTARKLGILDEVHMPIFNSYHQDRKQFRNAGDWADFFANYGADRDQAEKDFDSFEVTTSLRQNDHRLRAYGVSSTPEMVVDGRYRVSVGSAGGHRDMLRVVDYLVEKIRAE